MKREVFWGTILTIIFLLFNIASYATYQHIKDISTIEIHCGTIEVKEPQIRHTKHSSVTDYYMYINFDLISGRAIKVTPTTFYGKEIGDRVCFNLTKRELNSTYRIPFYMLFGMIGFIADIFLLLGGLITGIVYIDSKLK